MKFVTSLSNPDRQAKVLAAMKFVANSGQYANGFHIYKLQKHFQVAHDGAFATAFNSCGSALFAMYHYYKSIGHKTVAVQNNTAYATGAMALEAGLNLHIIDSSPKCPSMGIDSLKAALDDDKSITLVIVTHAGGFVAQDYADISNLCMDRNITLVEDCANSIGIDAGWQSPGKFGEASCWSFGMTSSLPCGTGGMLVTKNPELRNYVRKFVDYGKWVDGAATVRYEQGFNLRMSEYDAAVALVMVMDINTILEARARDFTALWQVAPCLITTATNNARYPIDASLMQKMSLAPCMYAAGDQLAGSLTHTKRIVFRNLPHSFRWAQNHRCLPVGEDLYAGMSDKDIIKALSK